MATSNSPLSIDAASTLQVTIDSAVTPPNPQGLIVSDGFESGDLSSPGYPNFEWDQGHREVVTMSPDGNPTILFRRSEYLNDELVGDPRDWTAKTGSNCLRFGYPGTAAGVYSSREQRWSLVNDMYPGATEIWMRFSLRVPVNYFLRGDQAAGNNHKFAIMWTDAYSAEETGGSIGWEIWPDVSVEPGGCYLSMNPQYGVVAGNVGQIQHVRGFILPSRDRGRWMDFCTQVVLAKKYDSNDGIIRVWRRWEDETEWTLIQEHLSSPVNEADPSTGIVGIREGYVLGWTNGGYTDDTEWLLDNFNLSTERLL